MYNDSSTDYSGIINNNKDKTEEEIREESAKLTTSFVKLYNLFFKCPTSNSKKNDCTQNVTNNLIYYLFKTEDQKGRQMIETLKDFMLEFVSKDGINWDFTNICKKNIIG